ncbi:hypothetical protein SALBM135S_02148 [Streptomyces alboniger]
MTFSVYVQRAFPAVVLRHVALSTCRSSASVGSSFELTGHGRTSCPYAEESPTSAVNVSEPGPSPDGAV